MSEEVGAVGEPRGLSESNWEALLQAIRLQQCTPFLGAGACAGSLRLGEEIAREWAKEWKFPFSDGRNLPQVAQYVSVHQNAMVPKLKIIEEFRRRRPPDFGNPNEPHRLVADLKQPVYITTNYDDFLFEAIKATGRTPRREVCRWQSAGPRKHTQAVHDVVASPLEPVVFHLHGTLDDHRSMVLTEDDYLDFLISISEDPGLIPPRIEEAFSASALLFLGYRLEDINFKILFRKLAPYLGRIEGPRHVSVQLAPRAKKPTPKEVARAERQRVYLEKRCNLIKAQIYWGTCQEFAADLRSRMEVPGAGR